MRSELVETLPLPQRLALSYAPRAAHSATLGLLALDQRLAGILRTGSEPIIAQIKLAWWRDRLAEPAANWPEGEPLLALLRGWPGGYAALGAMVDGWEVLLGDDLDERAVHDFAAGRAQGWAALAGAVAPERTDAARACGEFWALVDLALNLGNAEDRQFVREIALAQQPAPKLRGRALRSLAVLHALALRALERDAPALLGDAGGALLALRVGIAGR